MKGLSFVCAGNMQDTTRVCGNCQLADKKKKKDALHRFFINARKDALYQVPQGEKSERERRGRRRKKLGFNRPRCAPPPII